MLRPLAIAFALGAPFVAAVVISANLYDWSGWVALLLFGACCGVFGILAAELYEREQRRSGRHSRHRGLSGT